MQLAAALKIASMIGCKRNLPRESDLLPFTEGCACANCSAATPRC